MTGPQRPVEELHEPTELVHLSDAAYVLGALSPAERHAYEQHLAGCSRCSTSIQQLAVLPGLLSAVKDPQELLQFQLAAEPGSPDPEQPPETLLPRLLATADRRRRRRRWLVAGATGLMAACIAALIAVVVLRPAASAPVQAPAAQVQLVAAGGGQLGYGGGQMAVTVGLTDKQWGTALTITCHYQGGSTGDTGFRLFLIDKQQRAVEAGSWLETTSGTATVNAATALHRSDITRMQVRSATGQVLLEGTV